MVVNSKKMSDNELLIRLKIKTKCRKMMITAVSMYSVFRPRAYGKYSMVKDTDFSLRIWLYSLLPLRRHERGKEVDMTPKMLSTIAHCLKQTVWNFFFEKLSCLKNKIIKPCYFESVLIKHGILYGRGG